MTRRHMQRAHTQEARRILFVTLVLLTLTGGVAACGTILGDFPDGQMSSDASPNRTAGDEDAGLPPGAPQGAICIVKNAVVLDLAVDDSDVFVLDAKGATGEGFAVDACSKNGGQMRAIAAMPQQPEGFALSNDYVHWSVNQDTQHAGGVWRAPKRGGTLETAPWLSLDHASALTFQAPMIYAGAHTDSIQIENADTKAPYGRLDFSNPGSIAASPGAETNGFVFFSRLGTNDIEIVNIQGAKVVGYHEITTGYPSLPSFLSYDNDTLYWAVVAPTDSVVYSQTANSAQAVVTARQPVGFKMFAVRNGGLYWTAQEGDLGVVHGCPDLAHTPCGNDVADAGAPKLWSANVQISRIALDGQNVYFAASVGPDTYIVKHPR